MKVGGTPPGLADGTWRSLNSYSVWFAEYWRRGGFDGKLHFNNFTAEGVHSPQFYSSYPPGFMFPAYAVSWAAGVAPSFSFFAALGIGLHLFTSFLVGILLLLYGREEGEGAVMAALAALGAAAVYSFAPPAQIFYTAAWWPDTLAPTWMLILLLYELFLRARVRESWRAGLEVALAFASVYTDWLLVLFLFALIFARWREKQRPLWPFALGLGASVGVHLAFLLQTGVWPEFVTKISQRLGLLPVAPNEVPNIGSWFDMLRVFGSGYAYVIYLFVAVGVALVAWRRVRYRQISLRDQIIFFLALPCFAHNLLLLQHYRMHDYNTLKFTLLLAIFPFLFVIGRRWALGILLLATIAYYPAARARTLGWWSARLDAPKAEVEGCRLVAQNQKFPDYFFSPDFSTGQKFWLMPICYVTVREAKSPEILMNDYLKTANMEDRAKYGDKNIRVFFTEAPPSEWRRYLTLLASSEAGFVYSFQIP